VIEKIIVRFYAGYKGEETPRSILAGGREYMVEDIFSRRKCLEKVSGKSYEVFVCRVAGKTVRIRKLETGECELSPAGDFLSRLKK
jgi:hypothetical protein